MAPPPRLLAARRHPHVSFSDLIGIVTDKHSIKRSFTWHRRHILKGGGTFFLMICTSCYLENFWENLGVGVGDGSWEV